MFSWGIPRMSKVSSGHLLSVDTFFSVQWFCLQTVKALIRMCGCAGWSWSSLSVHAQRYVFVWHGPNMCILSYFRVFSVQILKQCQYNVYYNVYYTITSNKSSSLSLALWIKFYIYDTLKYCSYFFRKTGFDMETICMKCLILFSGKNKKNTTKLSSAK